jgi:hypothetical protein
METLMNRITRVLGVVFSLALLLGLSGPAAAQQFQGLSTQSPLFGQPSIGNASLVVKTVTGTIEDNGVFKTIFITTS